VGPPAIERDGRPAPPPRGRKAWALLAYLLVAERPPGRRQLAELLFGDADDPLGALRWTLAELRRALGQPGLFGGDPVATAVGPDVEVDLQVVAAEPADPAALLELGGELLEGMSVASSPAFESWLVVERHRVSAVVEARLRQAAMTLLASGRAEAAVAYASRAVARSPLEEGNHPAPGRGGQRHPAPRARRRAVSGPAGRGRYPGRRVGHRATGQRPGRGAQPARRRPGGDRRRRRPGRPGQPPPRRGRRRRLR